MKFNPAKKFKWNIISISKSYILMTETYFSGGAVHTVEKENMLETSISPVFNRFEGAGGSELIGIRSFQVKHTKSLCGKKKKKMVFVFQVCCI